MAVCRRFRVNGSTHVTQDVDRHVRLPEGTAFTQMRGDPLPIRQALSPGNAQDQPHDERSGGRDRCSPAKRADRGEPRTRPACGRRSRRRRPAAGSTRPVPPSRCGSTRPGGHQHVGLLDQLLTLTAGILQDALDLFASGRERSSGVSFLPSSGAAQGGPHRPLQARVR